MCTSSKTTTQFTRERAYTNRAKLLDGLPQQFFLHSSSLLLPRVKVENFFIQRMLWTLSYAVLKQAHYPQNLSFFFFPHLRKLNCSKILFNQLAHICR